MSGFVMHTPQCDGAGSYTKAVFGQSSLKVDKVSATLKDSESGPAVKELICFIPFHS